GANGFTAGNATGAMSVRLGPGNMAPHTHTYGFNLDTSRDGDHFHRIMGDDGLGMYLHKESYLNYDAKSHGGDGGVFWTTTNGAHTHHISHSGTTGNNTTGTSDPFNIVQPSIPIYVWVRNS
ncbi:hypothetical protein, partial [Modestobacter versicolor]|uniref:hypothetical protein n=1 Tax=Modestobacter versicolor TaxID=429133 RepID=UPI0034DF45C8